MSTPNKLPPTLTLELTIEEMNTLLEALGQMPYIRVYALINKLQDQAGRQVAAQNAPKEGEP